MPMVTKMTIRWSRQASSSGGIIQWTGGWSRICLIERGRELQAVIDQEMRAMTERARATLGHTTGDSWSGSRRSCT